MSSTPIRSTAQGGPGIVASGLVMYLDAANKNSYPGSGTTWYDLGISNMSGELTNGPTFDTGNAGNIIFDGVDDVILGTDTSGVLNIGAGNTVTLDGWIKSSTFGAQSIFTYGSDLYQKYWSYGFGVYGTSVTPNGLNLTVYNGISGGGNYNIASALRPKFGVWNNFTAVFGGTTSVYVNGIYARSISSPNNNIVSPVGNYWTIGGAPYNGFPSYGAFNGNIAAVKVYNRELSASEVLENYNASKSRFGL
tara:strand:- start:159 stop:908 length:750 start_codon:yes stop_codon:yes gene_type:complete